MAQIFSVHTNEIILKGNNRSHFEKRLINRLEGQLASVAPFKLLRRDGSVLHFESAVPLGESAQAAVTDIGRRTFGIAAFHLARDCNRDLDDIKILAAAMTQGRTGSFKVITARRDKRFPMPSMEVSREVGGSVLEANRDLAVDVHDPDFIVYVEIDYERAYVAVGREAGSGGLPTGVSGKVACLLSGGIDSPVAAWKMMRRGCEAVLVHCHSYPHVGRESIVKVERLAETLSRWQGRTRLWLVPLAEAQREVAAKADESYRILLYRRLMLRIAEAIALQEGALGIVTGDAVGQVASQTLANMAAVGRATTMPIYRPLVGDDKEDIVAVARRIGTFETSIERHDDCCSLFMPRRPVTHARLADVESEEAKIDAVRLAAEAVAAAEMKEID
jgi:thiamine biosynthesis protein ThiI